MKHMLLRLALVCLPVLVVGMMGAGPEAASAGLPPDGDPGTGSTVVLPDGTTVTLPQPFEEMPLDELVSYGIKPGEHGLVGVDAAATAPPDALPEDATKWSGSVLMVVKSKGGSGRTLIDWETATLPVSYRCSYAAYFTFTNHLWALSNTVCGTRFYSNVNRYLPLTFLDNTICNAWAGINGRPCAHVH
jgi:hypothetical protein